MIRQYLAASLLLSALAGPAVLQAQNSMLVSTDWLADHLDEANVVVVHVGNSDSYGEAHIPGARWIDPSAYAPAIDGMVTEMPEAGVLRDALEEAGISSDSRIVIYSATPTPQLAARLYLTLENFGLARNASLLDGGLPAWWQEGRAVSTEAVRVARGSLPELEAGTELVVDHEYVNARLDDGVTAVIDARDPGFWTGEDHAEALAPRPGRIPGALNVTFRTLVDEQGRLLPADELEEIFAEAGVDDDAPIIAYCHVGQQASLVTVAAKLLGRDVMIYDGSFQDWSQRTELPVETGP